MNTEDGIKDGILIADYNNTWTCESCGGTIRDNQGHSKGCGKMYRRTFLSIGSIFGLFGALVSPKKGQDTKTPCPDGHDLDMRYVEHPAISIGQSSEKGINRLVPCKNCGILFAVKTEESEFERISKINTKTILSAFKITI